MPRPTAAGVFGMARTIGVRVAERRLEGADRRAGGDREKERRAVAERREPRQRRAHHCGLTASTATAGSAGSSALSRRPCAGELAQPRRRVRLEHGDGGGRQAAGEPALEQRRAHLAAAEQHQAAAGDVAKAPWRPLPGPGREGGRASGATVGLGHGDAKRLLRRLAAPGDELERRVEPLAGGDRGAHHVVDLRRARRARRRRGSGRSGSPSASARARARRRRSSSGRWRGHRRVQRRRPAAPAAPCRRRRSAAASRRGRTRRASPNRSASCPRSPWRSGRRRSGRSPRTAPRPGSRRCRWGGVPRSRNRARQCPCPVPSRSGHRRGITPRGGGEVNNRSTAGAADLQDMV